MNPPLHPAAAIVEAVLNLPPDEREAYLMAVCGDDDALLAEIRVLLDAHDAAPMEFFEEPVEFDPAATLPFTPEERDEIAARAAEQEGDVIGPYKLLQQIGEGGFGTVWMAEQSKPISRKVALKVIKAGMDTKEVLARFEAERQALAMMDHANIAKVLDAGATDRGRPFFAMELVKGMPITQYCDEARLGTTARLALFGDVCSAIQHAHQKGIIHRDIKPSNVMITLHGDQPVVKVIDFGIAKATQGRLTDQTLFTRFEQFIGTPVYMSPEQASLSGLDIDTRSDIYALGVLLYELLTGKPPFDAKSLLSAGYEEMRRIIREVEPVKPSSRISTMGGEERTQFAKTRHIDPAKVARLVEPDLDWIVMKAIEKDRTRRYETASAFAQDIAHFLAVEPVSARPPSAGYQFRKFARRNKAALRIAAAIAAVLVAATGVSTWQAVRATKAEALAGDEAKRALTAEKQAKAEAARATAAEILAKDRLAEVAAERDAKEVALGDAEATSKFLTDMFASSQPGEKKGGREVKVADVLDRAVKELEANQAIPPVRRATLQATLGLTYHALGLYHDAVAMLEKVLAFHRTTHGPAHPDTLRAMEDLQRSYHRAGRRGEALTLEEELLTFRRKMSGPQHPDTLSAMKGLARSYHDAKRDNEALKMGEEVVALYRKVRGPEHPDTLRAMQLLGFYYSLAKRKDEALTLEEELLTLSRKVLGPEHPDTLSRMLSLSYYYYAAGRKDEALKLREELLALRRKVLGPEHPDTLRAMEDLKRSYYSAGRRDEALKLKEELLTLRRKMLGPGHPDTLSAMEGLARSYYFAKRYNEALKMSEEVLALCRKVLGPEHPDTLRAMRSLGLYYSLAKRKDEALTLEEELLTLRRKVLGPEHPDTLRTMDSLASYYSDAGRKDEALKLREEVLALCRKVLGPEHPDTLTVMEHLFHSYAIAGRIDKAFKLGEEVLALRGKRLTSSNDRSNEKIRQSEELLAFDRKHFGPEHPSTLSAMSSLAYSYNAAGRKDEALTIQDEVLTLSRKVLGPEHPDTLSRMLSLSYYYYAAGRKDEALKLREELLALRRKVLGPEHPDTLRAMEDLKRSYYSAGRRDEALKLEEELLTVRRKVPGPEHPDTLRAMYSLARSYTDAGREDEALKLREELLPLHRKVSGPEHPDTLWAMRNLARSYRAKGDVVRAEALEKEAAAKAKATAPPPASK